MAEQPIPTETVPKTELDKVTTQLTQTNQSLDAMRNQLLAPEYLEFLEARKMPIPAKAAPAANLNLSNMTVDDLRRVIIEGSAEVVRNALAPLTVKLNDVQAKQELADVRTEFPDFDKYSAQIVATLEANPKSDLTIKQAYLIVKGAAPAEAASAKPAEVPKAPTGGEKPGNTVPLSGDTLKTFKNGQEAGNAAWKEVAGRYNLQGDTI